MHDAQACAKRPCREVAQRRPGLCQAGRSRNAAQACAARWRNAPGRYRRASCHRAPHALAKSKRFRARFPAKGKKLVGRGGLEPPTSRLSGVRSNHLSYRPTCHPGSARRKGPVDPFEACAERPCRKVAQHRPSLAQRPCREVAHHRPGPCQAARPRGGATPGRQAHAAVAPRYATGCRTRLHGANAFAHWRLQEANAFAHWRLQGQTPS